MLVVTLAGVIFGVVAIAPGVGIVLAVVSLPALVRTAIFARRARRKQRPKGALGKALDFTGSVLVVALIAAAAYLAFVVALVAVVWVSCQLPRWQVPELFQPAATTIAIVVCAHVAIVGVAMLAWLLWTRRWAKWPRVLDRRREREDDP